MKNFNAYIGEVEAENIIFNAEKKLAILLYPKNASSSLSSVFGSRSRDWTMGKVSSFKGELSDYKIINCLRNPITKAISAMSHSLKHMQQEYGYHGGNDGRKFSLDKALDVHLRPQCCNVLSPHINNLNITPQDLNEYFADSGKSWNTFLEDCDVVHNVYSQVENPNQVWFLVSQHTNIVLDIAKYLNYNIGQHIETKLGEFDNLNNIDVSVTKSFIDSLEKTYKYDMLLFSKVKFENV